MIPTYFREAELPTLNLWLSENGTLVDFSSGYTFEFIISKSGESAVLSKTTGIAGSGSPGPNIVVSWSARDLDIAPGRYLWMLEATTGGLSRVFSGELEILDPLPIPRFSVTDGLLLGPTGVEFVGTGGNFETGVEGIDNFGLTYWGNGGGPRYTLRHDTIEGLSETVGQRFPYKVLTGHSNVFSSEGGGGQTIPSRAPAALNNWRMPIARMTCWLRSGPSTYPGSVPGTEIGTDITVPAYRANAQQLEASGMIAVPEHQAMTGTDPVLPAALVADPDLPTSDVAFSDDAIRDECNFLDDLAANLDPAKSWISLANEPYTGNRSTNFDDFVVTLVRRVRNAGWEGIIVVPTARYCQDLHQLSIGGYNSLVDRLASHNAEHDLLWDWHCYGNNHDGVATFGEYTYEAMDQQLSDLADGPGGYKYALLLGEYGEAAVLGQGTGGGNDAWNRTAVDILANDTYGQALIIKWKLRACLWHMTGDFYYSHPYSPTYGARNKGNGNLGPDPIPSTGEDPLNTEPGTMPWHDIDGSDESLEWLTKVGRLHWNIGRLIETWDV